MDRVVLHLDMDSFFAACEERRNPELRGKAVVVCVYSGRGGGSGAVSTANYEARKTGVKSGMACSLAKRLAPGAVFLPPDQELYRGTSDRIMAILRGYADRLEQVSIDEAYLEVTGDFTKAEGLAAEIKERINDSEGLTCSVGVGPNKLVAKVAAGYKKPDGLTAVPPEGVEAFLAPLPPSKLPGVGKKTGARLDELGMRTIGDLRKAGLELLVKEFGRAKGEWLRRAAHGIDEEPVEERLGTEQIGRLATFPEDTRDMEVISSTLLPMVKDIGERLAERGLAYRTVTVTFITEEFEAHTRSRTIPVPTKDLAILEKVAKELAAAFLAERNEKLRRIGLRVSDLGPERQRSLLEFG